MSEIGQYEAFWAKVQRGDPGECWPWLGFKKPSGHGLTSLNSLGIHASRKAWILTHGPIRGDFCVNHRCDNAACCNPEHLYLGTRADNMIDRFRSPSAASRSARGRPFILTDRQMAQLWQMRREGATLKECASQFDVHVATICRYITAVRKQKLAKNRTDRLSAIAKLSV